MSVSHPGQPQGSRQEPRETMKKFTSSIGGGGVNFTEYGGAVWGMQGLACERGAIRRGTALQMDEQQ